jgi:hypothetical protein
MIVIEKYVLSVLGGLETACSAEDLCLESGWKVGVADTPSVVVSSSPFVQDARPEPKALSTASKTCLTLFMAGTGTSFPASPSS